jgi:hypothetical protein
LIGITNSLDRTQASQVHCDGGVTAAALTLQLVVRIAEDANAQGWA